MSDITVTIARNKLVYDIDVISWNVAKCRIPQPRARAEAQTDSEADSKFVIERQIGYAINNIKQTVRWCRQTSSTTGDNDMTVNAAGSYSFTFRTPAGWQSDADQLGALINRYIVTRVLADWFGQVMPAEVTAYSAQADAVLDEIVALFLRDAPSSPYFVTEP